MRQVVNLEKYTTNNYFDSEHITRRSNYSPRPIVYHDWKSIRHFEIAVAGSEFPTAVARYVLESLRYVKVRRLQMMKAFQFKF